MTSLFFYQNIPKNDHSNSIVSLQSSPRTTTPTVSLSNNVSVHNQELFSLNKLEQNVSESPKTSSDNHTVLTQSNVNKSSNNIDSNYLDITSAYNDPRYNHNNNKPSTSTQSNSIQSSIPTNLLRGNTGNLEDISRTPAYRESNLIRPPPIYYQTTTTTSAAKDDDAKRYSNRYLPSGWLASQSKSTLNNKDELNRVPKRSRSIIDNYLPKNNNNNNNQRQSRSKTTSSTSNSGYKVEPVYTSSNDSKKIIVVKISKNSNATIVDIVDVLPPSSNSNNQTKKGEYQAIKNNNTTNKNPLYMTQGGFRFDYTLENLYKLGFPPNHQYKTILKENEVGFLAPPPPSLSPPPRIARAKSAVPILRYRSKTVDEKRNALPKRVRFLNA